MMDLAIGVTPVIGPARDIFEAVSGRNVLTGESLTDWERGFAVAGAVLVGAVAPVGAAIGATALFKTAFAEKLGATGTHAGKRREGPRTGRAVSAGNGET